MLAKTAKPSIGDDFQMAPLVHGVDAAELRALVAEVLALREQRDKVLALCKQWTEEPLTDGSLFSEFMMTLGIIAHVHRALDITEETD